MIRECFKTHSGILFHADGLRKVGLDPACLYPIVLPRPPALPLDKSAPETAYIQKVPKKAPAPAVDDDDEEETTALLGAKSQMEAEELADLKDSLAPVYDQLSLAWFWWFLELIPLRVRFQDSDNDTVWVSKFKINFGRGRHVPKQRRQGVRVHRSVKTRLEAEFANGQKYSPKAGLKLEHVTWVD